MGNIEAIEKINEEMDELVIEMEMLEVDRDRENLHDSGYWEMLDNIYKGIAEDEAREEALADVDEGDFADCMGYEILCDEITFDDLNGFQYADDERPTPKKREELPEWKIFQINEARAAARRRT